jgi:prepilin-type processing-associated H-X9-DG protein/prepilin-type N-terminal cleavage/methylation domain-containing protein
VKTPAPPSFTLVELLVVVSIIGLLAGLAIPAVQGGLTAARKAESVSQLKQLGTLAVAYTAENSGNFPEEGGEGLQGFSQLRQATNAWYNVLPPMAGFLAASNYRANPSSFYEKGSLFFVRGAKYPAAKLNSAYFAYGINSQLQQDDSAASILNANRIQKPSKTALFAEARLPDERALPPSGGAMDSLGQPKVRDRRFVARHNGQGIVVFCDGHAESIPADKATDTNTVIWEQL